MNFFFSSRRRHTRFDCDWSSDVCSSDLECGIHSDGDLDWQRRGSATSARHRGHWRLGHIDVADTAGVANTVQLGRNDGKALRCVTGQDMTRKPADRSGRVSYMTPATTTPETKVNAAMAPIAKGMVKASASTPAAIAPMA